MRASAVGEIRHLRFELSYACGEHIGTAEHQLKLRVHPLDGRRHQLDIGRQTDAAVRGEGDGGHTGRKAQLSTEVSECLLCLCQLRADVRVLLLGIQRYATKEPWARLGTRQLRLRCCRSRSAARMLIATAVSTCFGRERSL